MQTPVRIPLTAHAQRIVDDVTLQMPTAPTILRDVEIGGPREGSDRRCLLESRDLRKLLEIARSSSARCAVLHHFGLRVQMIREDDGHRWNNVRLLGAPAPAPAPGAARRTDGLGRPATGEPLPLSALSARLHTRTAVQLPDRAEIVADVELGADGCDRRLLLSVSMLDLLLAHAEESTTMRCVVHGFGLRVQALQDDGGHQWTHCYVIGHLSPEISSLQSFTVKDGLGDPQGIVGRG